MTQIEDYFVTSRHYLLRARKRLDENTPASLFYAAFELRCGVESRMQEYLDAQDHISKQKKKGWQIAKLGHNIERAFSLGDKIAEISVRDKGSGGLIIRAFYTPVTKALRQKAEGLNAYMHAQRQHHPLNTSWWEIFRTRLESVYTDLAIANRGTLLGPPLWNPKTRQMQMPMEILHDEDTNYKKLVSIKKGTELIIKVDYRETLPN